MEFINQKISYTCINLQSQLTEFPSFLTSRRRIQAAERFCSERGHLKEP